MKCVYHPSYQVVPPPGQVGGADFPLSKHPLLRARLLAEGVLVPDDFVEPEPIAQKTLELVHTPEYLSKLATASLTAAEQRRLGMPWSHASWLRSLLTTGGTLLAARMALQGGLSGNLAGGSHHAFADHGEGFCALNDVAIAIAQLRAERAIRRALIVDLDVHQGNGSAAIFQPVEEVFTFSMHAEKNYPSQKMRSNLDISLPDGTGDADYLGELDRHLPEVLERANPDLVFYLAGVDVAAGDRFGKLALSDEGIRLRDQRVIVAVRGRGLPLVITLAGGYAASRARTAELHAHVFREAVHYERRVRSRSHAP